MVWIHVLNCGYHEHLELQPKQELEHNNEDLTMDFDSKALTPLVWVPLLEAVALTIFLEILMPSNSVSLSPFSLSQQSATAAARGN